MRNHAVSLAALFTALTLASSADAADSPADTKAADALFQNGRAAMDRGDYVTACAQFTQSQHLDPAVGTLLNLGECETRAGKLAAALGHLREARSGLAAGDDRIAFADAHIADLAHRVPTLAVKLRTSVTGVVVSCDGVELTPASLGKASPIDPGKHVCRASALGHPDAEAAITLGEGEHRTLDLSFEAPGTAPAGGGAAAEPASPASPTSSPGSTQRITGLAVGGAGAVGLIVGGIFGLVAKHTYDQATTSCAQVPEPCQKAGVDGGQTAHGQATVSTVSFVVGAALVAGGAALYLTAPDHGAVAVAPSVGANAAGLTVRGSW